MKRFAALYRAIDETNRTSEKVAAIAAYLREAPAADAALAIAFLTGRRPKRLISRPQLKRWATEAAGLPTWLFESCYEAVGDLADSDGFPVGKCVDPGVVADPSA